MLTFPQIKTFISKANLNLYMTNWIKLIKLTTMTSCSCIEILALLLLVHYIRVRCNLFYSFVRQRNCCKILQSKKCPHYFLKH